MKSMSLNKRKKTCKTTLNRKIKGRIETGCEWLTGARTKNIGTYLSIETIQHKTRKSGIRRLLMRLKMRRCMQNARLMKGKVGRPAI